MEPRRAWARNPDEVRYCSAACRRRRRPRGDDVELERAIVRLLDERPRGATICPAEAARAVRPDDWREWMERTRAAARRLCAGGRLEIVQGGRAVDPSTARGPIRLRLVTG